MRGVVLLSVALAFGCGPQSYDEFRDQLSKASCDRMIRCGQTGASERAHCLPMTLVVPPEEDVNVAVNKGRLRFFSDAAQSCIDAVNDAPCDDNLLAYRIAIHCHHVVEPGVPAGGSCFADECEGGVCQESGSMPGCGGTCIGFAEPGMACMDAGPPANTCDPTVAYCAGTCQQKKQAGEPCANDLECGYGWFCVNGSCGDAIFAKLGAPCGGDNPPCEENGYCATSGVCAAQAEKGKPCDNAPYSCKAGATCIDGTCQPWKDVGQPCDGPLNGGCPLDSYCVNGVCANNGSGANGLDQRCTGDNECQGALFCRFGVCKFRVGSGGSCLGVPSACEAGLTCEDATHTCVRASCTL
jgi:hypothetical protein